MLLRIESLSLALWLLGAPAEALERLRSSSGASEIAAEANSVGFEEEASDFELRQLKQTWHDGWKAEGASARIQRQFAQEQKANALAADSFRKSDKDMQRLLLGQVATRIGRLHRVAGTSVASQALSDATVSGWTLPHLSVLGTIAVFAMCFIFLMCLGCLSPAVAEAEAQLPTIMKLAGLLAWPAFFIFLFVLFAFAGAVVLFEEGVLKDALNETIMNLYLLFVGIGLVVIAIWQVIRVTSDHTQDLQADLHAARRFLPDLKHKVDHLLQAVGLESDSEGEEVPDMYGRGSKKKMRKQRWLPTLACGGSNGASQKEGKGKGNGVQGK